MSALARGAGTLGLGLSVALAGCLGPAAREKPRPPAPGRVAPAPPAAPPSAGIDAIPDAVPRVEPRSRYGNPPFYEVFGVRYYVLSSSADYVERGVASWYGPGFHKVRTSTGEPYDMYAMTAAHKTLPLPAYVRVTNLQNGRSCVVRVNDRGPFVGHRIIDLSYSAAAKLDMLRDGTAMVEVRSIDPTAPLGPSPSQPLGPPLTAEALAPARASSAYPGTTPTPMPAATPVAVTGEAAVAAPAGVTAVSVSGAAPTGAAPAGSSPIVAMTATVSSGPPATAAPVLDPNRAANAPATLYIQAGAFADPHNATRLAERLQGGGYGQVFVRQDLVAGRTLYRVRIGPVPTVADFDRIVIALERVGVRDAHLALD